MPTITTKDGVEIFYKDWGSGQPIVFSHGWPLSADDWDTQMLFFLHHGYRVIAHDRRGHGRSTRPRTATTWTIMPTIWRLDGPSRPERCRPCRPFHRRRRGGALSGTAWRKPGRQGGADQRGAASDVEDGGQSAGPSQGGVRWPAGATRRQSFAIYRDIAAGPFYGYNRPGAKVSEAVIQNWWRQGMMGGAKAHYDGIVAFSQTDFTEDLKKITVPAFVMHGDDNQIVPYVASGPQSAKLLKSGTLKTYKGFPHGMPTTEADTINSDLLAFIES